MSVISTRYTHKKGDYQGINLIYKRIKEPGEMTQQLRVFAAFVEGLSLDLSTYVSSQLPITSAIGDSIFSSGLHGYSNT